MIADGSEQVGRELGGYRVEAVLGSGAMGVVYRAVDPGLGRTVALKVLTGELATDERFQRRFARESRTVARLDHPHIVSVYSAGESGGQRYIAMRYVDGGDLAGVLDRDGPLDLPRTVRLLGQVADALDAAHDEGLVHRDVKPANILIEMRRTGEHCFLSDFGIAKPQTDGSDLTGTGQIIGTTSYMAPEQIEARPLDGRADQYALGCVVHQCLTGSPPYPRGDYFATLWAHLQDPPPPVTAGRPDLPRAVDDVVARALAKQPRERYGSCRELAEALAEALGTAVGEAGWGSADPYATAAAPLLVGTSSAPRDGTDPTSVPTDAAVPDAGGDPTVASRTPWRPWARRPRLVFGAAAVVLLGLVAVLLAVRDPFPDEREAALLAVLPAALRVDCERGAGEDGAGEGAVRCVPESGAEQVTVSRFASVAGLGTAYDRQVEQAGVAPDSGDCATATGAELAHPRGRLLCHRSGGQPTITWTDDEQRFLATASRSDGDHRTLYTWWAGLAGVADSGGFPTPDEQTLLAALPETDCGRALESVPGAVAGVRCEPQGEGAGAVRYYRFLDVNGMQTAYGQSVQAVQPPVGPRCDENPPPDFLAEEEWTQRDQPQGRLLCYRRPSGEAVVEWTHEGLLILGRAEGPDPAALAGWWRSSSGPLRSVVADGRPFPTAAEQALLDGLPAAVRTNCRRPPPAEVAGRVAGVECGPVGAAETVQFYAYTELAALQRAYRVVATQFPSPAGCADDPPGSVGQGRYSVDGRDAGGLVCFPLPDDGRPSILWTDESALVQAQAVGDDLGALVDWWRDHDGTVREL